MQGNDEGRHTERAPQQSELRPHLRPRLLDCSGQIDLTDDYVVISLFGDGAWETSIQRLVGKDDAGDPVDVYLDQASFRDLLSIVGPPQ